MGMPTLARAIASVVLVTTALGCGDDLPVADGGPTWLASAIDGLAAVVGTVTEVHDDGASAEIVVAVESVTWVDPDEPGWERVVDELGPGDELVLVTDAGWFDVGETVAIVTGRWGDGEQSVLYAHDPVSDEPRPPFDRDGSVETGPELDCLVERFGGDSRFDALVAAAQAYRASGSDADADSWLADTHGCPPTG